MPINKSAYDRYLAIDEVLHNKQIKPTITLLKERVEEKIGKSISKDMLNKDLAAMRNDYNAPIKYHKSDKYYYYDDPGFSLNKFPLNEKEVEALRLAPALLDKLKGSSVYADFESAISKVIRGYRIENLIGQHEKKILQAETTDENDGTEWIEPLINHILLKEAITLNYKSYQRNETAHTLSPYLLKEYMKRWYLIAYNHKKSSITTFGLDRIINITKAEDRYIRDEHFSEDDYFEYCLGIMKNDELPPQKIILEFLAFQKPYIKTRKIHKSQRIIEETHDKLTIELTLYITHELIQKILSYGNEVKVLAPDKLINQIKTKQYE